MSEDSSLTHINDLIPKNLNDIIRANRDKFRLAIATDEERQALGCDLPNAAASKVCHTLRGWNILMTLGALGAYGLGYRHCSARQPELDANAAA